MSGKSLLLLASLFLVLAPPGTATSRGDFEDKLLEKFRQEKESAGQALRREVAEALARAGSQAPAEPQELVTLLRRALSRLRDDHTLPQADREALLRQVQQRLRALETLVAENERKETLERPQEPRPPKREATLERQRTQPDEAGRGLQASGGGLPTGGNLQVTPVVVGGGRFVRVRVAGTFTVPNYNTPLVPIQIPVPTVLYGSNGPIVGQPVKIFQVFVPRPVPTTISLNTTATVPSGGAAVVGGFSSVAQGRNEFGPPGLSGVPGFNRVVRNVGYGRALQAPRIVIGARVFSMREEEERFLAQGGGR
jgi:hypothetical protein